MVLKGIDLVTTSKLTTVQVEQITCLECCKYYTAPETAVCGHTLCHSCWKGRRSCPKCTGPLDRKKLRLNLPLQNLTEHVHALGAAFEKLFNVKLDEFTLDTPGGFETEDDPTKNVKAWLANSENEFSAPQSTDPRLTQDPEIQDCIPNPLEISSNKIQIHTSANLRKINSPDKIIHVSTPQDDWDKIEPLPHTEEITKDKENIVGPMDIEHFFFDVDEYTNGNPRRSSRKRDIINNENTSKTNVSLDKPSSKESSGDTDNKTSKASKQTWGNVKKMRKEFCKLNKKNRNKLNVSIEMCKKTQNIVKSTKNTDAVTSVSQNVYEIDENTPIIENIQEKCNKVSALEVNRENFTDSKNDKPTNLSQHSLNSKKSTQVLNCINIENCKELITEKTENNNETSLNHNVKFKKESSKTSFIKKSALHPEIPEKLITNQINPSIEVNDHVIDSTNSDDIEITIKIGNTITNIVIKKKNDVQLKVNTDREIQTSLGQHNLSVKNIGTSTNDVKVQNIEINIGSNEKPPQTELSNSLKGKEKCTLPSTTQKSASAKKNTASAETVTAQFEITESVEKELSKIMEVDPTNEEQIASNNSTPISQITQTKNAVSQAKGIDNPGEYINDLDIFESESLKDTDVQLLKHTKAAPSEILVSTHKNKTQRNADKRDREVTDDEIYATNKRRRTNQDIEPNNTVVSEQNKSIHQDSEPMNYDVIMDQVFANIDADIEVIRKSQNIDKNTCTIIDTQKEKVDQTQETYRKTASKIVSTQNLRHSENIFSVCAEKDGEHSQTIFRNMEEAAQEVPTMEDFLTPVVCRESRGPSQSEAVEILDGNESDRSVVEETPQKDLSFPKLKQKSSASRDLMTSQKPKSIEKTIKESENAKSIVSITDSLAETRSVKDVTIVEAAARKTLETPLTINKFVNQIKHNSTPVARKSLNFDKDDDNDPEQTLCPTGEPIAETTQEKEFLRKAFEKTPTILRSAPRMALRPQKRFVLAGSCLSAAELSRVKVLCAEYNWPFVDKFTKDLTHLVVGVDEENKSQRSVKYMCALAASKWIVSPDWIEQCLKTKQVVSEERFEVLDSTGEAGPRRARLATNKLFHGVSFYCMPPFSVLDVDTLKLMLESAGGRVVREVKEVRVTADTRLPALLLAEPENTQEDRFIYLAMELSIVPVNYEWVLNCLGGYSLGSVYDLLLCPSSLLPPATAKWPPMLLARDDE